MAVALSLTVDLNDISDDTVKQLCAGSHVFFNCLGTTRKQAGSAVGYASAWSFTNV